MVPLKVFEKKRLIKLEIGLARARQKQDKREVIKKREDQRRIEKALRQSKR